MYQLWGGGAPFKPNKDGTLSDASGTRCYLMGASAKILSDLRTDPQWKDTKVAPQPLGKLRVLKSRLSRNLRGVHEILQRIDF